MNLVEELGKGLDGLGQLRALMASGRSPGILRALDFELMEIDRGRAVFAGTPGAHAYNPIGTVHGATRRRYSIRPAVAPYIRGSPLLRPIRRSI
jgi:hypothetical protein